MDDPADAGRSGVRDVAGELFYAGVGAVAFTKDRADELVDELSKRGRMSRAEARDVVDDVTGRWRGEALRFGERASFGVSGMLRELGLVTRREWEELELRLSQLEHRLRLVEDGPQAGRPRPPRP